MRRSRLNLGALRSAPAPATPAPTTGDFLRAPEKELSRRHFITVAGVSAVIGSQVYKRTSGALSGQYELRADAHRAVFSLAGSARWVIDTKKFGGSPQLSVYRDKGKLHVALERATWPGTNLPADFSCVISPGLSESSMTITMALGDFHATVPFEQWLLGLVAAQSDITFANAPVCALGPNGGATIGGNGEAQFFPSWKFLARGEQLASVEGAIGSIDSGNISIALGEENETGILRTRPARRTFIRMEREQKTWNVVPAIHGGDEWTLESDVNAFDTFTIEAGLDASGAVRQGVRADAAGSHGLVFRSGEKLHNGTGENFKMQLRNARYAVAYYPDREDQSIVASLHTAPVWAHARGFSLELTDAPHANAFEALAIDGVVQRMKCTPQVKRVSLQFNDSDAIVEPLHAAPGALLAYSGGVFQSNTIIKESLPPNVDLHNIIVQQNSGIISLSTSLPLMVVRPDDLLHVGFSFVNLKLNSSAGGGYELDVVDPKLDAYLVAYLPPQNIAEEAFYEIGPPPLKKDPRDPDQSTGEQIPPMPPVRSRLSGWSRISLIVYLRSIPIADAVLDPAEIASLEQQTVLKPVRPNQTPTLSPNSPYDPFTGLAQLGKAPAIPFSLSGLLNWTRYLMNVSANAMPMNPGQASYQHLQLPYAPVPKETAIESPYRLIISPDIYGVWVNAVRPVSHPDPNDSTKNWTELWHTRLGYRLPDGSIFEGETRLKIIRAVWSPDYDPTISGKAWTKNDNVPFRMSLTPSDRKEIVALSTQPMGGNEGANYIPKPIQAKNLMLSALGSWMDTQGDWNPPNTMSVEQWVHRATLGRDHYVRVEYKGYLYPFGHRATLVKVTERKFQPTPKGDIAAYLRQRMFIIVRDPLKYYNLIPNAGREMPFTNLRIKTIVTPNLDDPTASAQSIKGLGQTGFWIRGHANDILFHMEGEDYEGKKIEFTAPLIFVDNTKAHDITTTSDLAKKIIPEYDTAANADRSTLQIAGQQVAFAPTKKSGDTSYPTDTIRFTGHVRPTMPLPAEGDVPAFYPSMRTAALKIPTITHMTGKPGDATILYNQNYADKGYGQGEVFAELQTIVPLKFSGGGEKSGDKVGGLSSPNMSLSGLSRLTGVVGGDVSKMATPPGTNANFDPSTIFKALDSAYILGAVPLGELVKAVLGNQFASDIEKLPKFLNSFRFPVPDPNAAITLLTNVLNEATGTLPAGDAKTMAQQWLATITQIKNDLSGADAAKIASAPDKLQDLIGQMMQNLASVAAPIISALSNPADLLKLIIPDRITIHFDWRPEVQNWPSSNPIFIIKGSPTDTLVVSVLFEKKFDGSAPTFTITAYLQKVEVHLLPAVMDFLYVPINKIQFLTEVGKKTDITADIGTVQFVGALSFVAKLAEILSSNGAGFDDPPSVDVDSTGITAGFSLDLPTIAVGVMSIQNISLGAQARLPFIGDPLSFTFNFCTEEKPFVLSVMIFGGGGFFAITLNPNGLYKLVASFEFGATFCIDLGVASGEAHLMAGIYFAYQSSGVSLTGFVKLGGSLSILGLIHASLEFDLSLTYQFNTGKCWGEATLSVEVSVLFFSFSVDVHVEKQFKGSSGDPTIRQTLTAGDWADYCSAFA